MTNKTYVLALLTAFLLWLAWPPIPFTGPLLFFALVPLLFAVEGLIQSESGRKGARIFGLCFATFVIWNTASIYWVFNSLDAVMPVWIAVLVSLIPFGLGALLMTLAFWGYYQCRKISTPVWAYAALIAFWMGYEYLHQSWDLAFPWMNLGNGFAQTHQLVQWYAYTGVYGGTLWVLLSNILLFEIIKNRSQEKRKNRLAIAWLTWVLVPVIFSVYLYQTYQEAENPANVVVVQPNIDPYAKYGSMPAAAQVERLIQLSDSVGQKNTEYFIWPETAIPEYASEEEIRNNPHFMRVQQFLNNYKNGNVLSGLESYRTYRDAQTPTARPLDESGLYFDSFNAAVQVENSAKVQFYHKSKLVPGVEQLPFAHALAFLKPVFAAFGGATGGYGRQEKPSVFYAQSGMGVSPVICYESIWGDYVAESVRQGASFIAIMTNDGWWGNTSGKDQHLAYAKLRAIENRRWVARSANTGISAFINQRGDVVQQSQWWTATALKADINLNEEQTFYTRNGEWLAALFSVIALLFAAVLVFVRMKNFRKNKQ